MELIQAKNYSFCYPEQINDALSLESLTIRQGEICLLAGPSGCGKTTLLRQLAGVTELQGRQEGELINHAKKISYVWQNPENQIVTDSVFYEIVFGLENRGVKKEHMQRRLAEVVTVFGLEKLAERDTMQLSGGEKQIVNVASSLAVNPDLLLLDEPTSQLDPVAAKRLFELLHEINEEYGITIVIAEQRLEDLVPVVDRIVCMEAGRIVEQGEPRSVFSKVKDSSFADFFPTYMRLGADVLSKKEARLWFEKNYEPSEQTQEKPADTLNQKTEKRGIALRDLYFRYERESGDVLSSCNGFFSQGKCICLMGGNGSGKTTLLRILAGQFKPYHGRVRDLPRTKAYLPQEPAYLFLKDSVGEECRELTEKGMPFFEGFGMSGLENRHPYDLSGGEKQRLALSLVLGQEAALYLLDEPTKGMDAGAKRYLGELMKQRSRQGKTVIFVSHDMEFAARYADEAALMFQGQIVQHCETRDFFEENQFYTTSINRVARRVSPHIITMEDVDRYATKKD